MQAESSISGSQDLSTDYWSMLEGAAGHSEVWDAVKRGESVCADLICLRLALIPSREELPDFVCDIYDEEREALSSLVICEELEVADKFDTGHIQFIRRLR